MSLTTDFYQISKWVMESVIAPRRFLYHNRKGGMKLKKE